MREQATCSRSPASTRHMLMKSFTFYLTLLVIKLKGVKRDFSQDPIDYRKLRKEDVHQPGSKALRPHQLQQYTLADTLVTEVRPDAGNKCLVLFCHGGAFVYGPAQHHWDTARQIVSATGCTLWMVDYPKAPEHKIDTISANLDAVYAKALESFRAENIILLGDSVGGTLVTSLTQWLVQQGAALPAQLILLSPVMDASVSNPEITELDQTDPILSRAGVSSAKRMCALNGDLTNPMISPLYGDFTGFPRTTLFLADNDITYPDQKLAAKKMANANVDLTVIVGEGMPHIWPVLPVMQEAKTALHQITEQIKETAQQPAYA